MTTSSISQPRRAALVLLVLWSAACAASQPAVRAPAAAAQAKQLLPEAIRWVRTSAEHRALFLQVYADASARVREAAPGRTKGTWGVILDADETVLDNSAYQMRRAAQGLGFTIETWNAWVREEGATALPGAAAFIALVRDLGGRIAIVTNRDDEVCPETRRNLAALGIVTDVVLCRVGGISDKNPRFESVRRGTAAREIGPVDVVAWVGDNILDFPGLSQDLRTAAPEAFAEFGRRYFMLPNPMYGSWERLTVQ